MEYIESLNKVSVEQVLSGFYVYAVQRNTGRSETDRAWHLGADETVPACPNTMRDDMHDIAHSVTTDRLNIRSFSQDLAV